MGYGDIPYRTFSDVFDMQVVELIGTRRGLRDYTIYSLAQSLPNVADQGLTQRYNTQ